MMKKGKNILMCKCHVTITKQGASKNKTLWCRKSYKSTVFLQVQHSRSNNISFFKEVPSVASLIVAKQQQHLEKIKNIAGYTECNRKRDWVLEDMWFITEYRYGKTWSPNLRKFCKAYSSIPSLIITEVFVFAVGLLQGVMFFHWCEQFIMRDLFWDSKNC